MKRLCSNFLCPGDSTPKEGSDYCSEMPGICQGLNGYLNSKFRADVNTSDVCQAYCDNNASCVGYEFSASNKSCFLFGQGMNTDLTDGWNATTSYPNATSTITGSLKFNNLGDQVCVAKAGKN